MISQPKTKVKNRSISLQASNHCIMLHLSITLFGTLWGCLGLKRLAQKQVIKEPRIPEYVWGLSLPASLTDGCSAESSEGFACASVRRSPTVSDGDLLLWDALGLKSKRPSIKVSDRQFAFDYSICRHSTIVSLWIYTLWPRSQRALQSVSSPVGRSTPSRSGIICTYIYIHYV